MTYSNVRVYLVIKRSTFENLANPLLETTNSKMAKKSQRRKSTLN